jgi:hypothetical protein
MRHPHLRLIVLAAACAAQLCGCRSQPDRDEVLVTTAPPGASCTLTRLGQPIATVVPTPAIALVDPGSDEIAIHCSRQGFADATATLPAQEGTWFSFAAAPLYGRPSSEIQRRVDLVLAPL